MAVYTYEKRLEGKEFWEGKVAKYLSAPEKISDFCRKEELHYDQFRSKLKQSSKYQKYRKRLKNHLVTQNS